MRPPSKSHRAQNASQNRPSGAKTSKIEITGCSKDVFLKQPSARYVSNHTLRESWYSFGSFGCFLLGFSTVCTPLDAFGLRLRCRPIETYLNDPFRWCSVGRLRWKPTYMHDTLRCDFHLFRQHATPSHSHLSICDICRRATYAQTARHQTQCRTPAENLQETCKNECKRTLASKSKNGVLQFLKRRQPPQKACYKT